MQEIEATVTFEELPDTITPKDYAKWRRIGTHTAREIFNSEGFPRLKGTGVKQLADKRVVYMHELGLKKEELQVVLKEVAKQIISKGVENEKS